MTTAIYTKPGKTISMTLSVFDGYVLADALSIPKIKAIYKPDLTTIDGYPQDMTKIDTGIYIFDYLIPKHPSSIGNFIIDIEYTDPNSNILNKIYQIIVQYPGLAGHNFGIILTSS